MWNFENKFGHLSTENIELVKNGNIPEEGAQITKMFGSSDAGGIRSANSHRKTNW